MRKSPIYPKYERSDYGDAEFDPEADFFQFLDEARLHKREPDARDFSPDTEAVGQKRLAEAEDKKSKKSWKSSLLSWLKTEKKRKPRIEPVSNNHHNKSVLKKGHVSGPINGSTKEFDARPRRLNSGSLSGLFNSKRRAENDMSYMTLEDSNEPHRANAYGPVYLVT